MPARGPTKLPFDYAGEFVEYRGNEKSLQNYVDLEQLFTTNLPGTEVFGGISGEVRGTTDLDPQLTEDTLLTSINGGNGIDTNAAISINVTNGPSTTSSIIDLSGAVTIGDVIRRIEANPPAGGASIRVEIVDNGLTVTTDGRHGPHRRSGGRPRGQGTRHFHADLRPCRRLDGRQRSGPRGADDDAAVRFVRHQGDRPAGLDQREQRHRHRRRPRTAPTSNGVTVVYVPGGAAGSEIVSYDSFTKTLTVQIEDGESTANDVIAAINAEGTFTAKLDGRDETSVDLAGTGKVNINNFGIVTAGGSGTALDTASGLILTNGGDPVTLDISSAETVEDLFNLITGADVGLSASINAEGNGINVRSVLSGADFTIGENGGTTATQLGIRTYTGATQLADFNRGVGVDNVRRDAGARPHAVGQLEHRRPRRHGAGRQSGRRRLAAGRRRSHQHGRGKPRGHNRPSPRASINSANGIVLADSSTPITGGLIVQNPVGTTAAEYLRLCARWPDASLHHRRRATGNYVLSGGERRRQRSVDHGPRRHAVLGRPHRCRHRSGRHRRASTPRRPTRASH